MRRRIAWAAGLTAVAVVIGCGPGKELPDAVPGHKGPAEPTEPEAKIPAASDPAAKAVVEKAVAAITGSDPKKLEKARVSVRKERGGVQFPNTPQLTDANRRVEAVWPDRSRFTAEFQGGLPTKVFVLHYPFGWLTVGGVVWTPPNPIELPAVIRHDTVGLHWLPLGVPLLEPTAVVFDAQKATGGRPATSVKFGMRELPVYTLTFDDQSGQLVRIAYAPTEWGQRTRKLVTLGDYKPFAGLTLPTTVELQENGSLAERWSVEAWEFPEKIDDATFQQPK